jgi:hypothetical protein
MEYTKAELQEMAANEGYFDKYPSMYATADGNFFNPENRNYAQAHAKKQKIELFELTPEPAPATTSKKTGKKAGK